MRLKVLAVLSVLSLVSASATFAQDTTKQTTKRQGGAQRQPRLASAGDIETATRALNLTDDQKTKLAEFVAAFTTSVNATLTPEQQGKLKVELTRLSQSQRGPESMLMTLDAAVTLTAEQKPKALVMIMEYQKSLKDKVKDLSPEERRTVSQQSVSDLKAALKAVLNAEQQAKLDDWRPNTRGRAQGQTPKEPKPGKP